MQEAALLRAVVQRCRDKDDAVRQVRWRLDVPWHASSYTFLQAGCVSSALDPTLLT